MKRFCSVLVAVAGVGFSSCAQGIDDMAFCSMVLAQATARSAVLGAPEAFASVGDSSTPDHVVTLGIRKSLSGAHQASLMNAIAVSQCEAYTVRQALTNELAAMESRIERAGIEAKEPKLLEALAMAEANVAVEQRLLQSLNATLGDERNALDTRDRLQRELATLAARRAQLQDFPAFTVQPLASLIEQDILAQGRLARMTAELSGSSGWDVSVSVGGRQNFTQRTQSKFLTITASRSFGLPESERAVQEVGIHSMRFAREARDGATQQVRRSIDTLHGVAAAEALMSRSLAHRMAALTAALARVVDSRTTETSRFSRALRAEMAMVAAEQAAVDARVRAIEHWLAVHDAR